MYKTSQNPLLDYAHSTVLMSSLANAGDARDAGMIREDPLEKEMATHSSILAWKIP